MAANGPSASTVIAIHLADLPARYAIGRWNNIPLSNILVFNGIDLCTNLLIKEIAAIFLNSFKLEHRDYPLQVWCLNLSTRVIACITAYYAASYLKKPLPIQVAALSNLAALATSLAAITFDMYIYPGLGKP